MGLTLELPRRSAKQTGSLILIYSSGWDVSLLGCKEIKPVHPKGNQPGLVTARTGAEADAPVLWPPDTKTLMEKTLMLGRLKAKKEKGVAEDGITDSVDMNLSKFQETVEGREAWGAAVHGVKKSWTRLSD